MTDETTESYTWCYSCDCTVDFDGHFDDLGNCEFADIRDVLYEARRQNEAAN